MLQDNYERVLAEIKQACESSGRNISDITLVAVSKTFPANDVKELYELGHHDFGENKVQELTDKHSDLESKDIKWHLIGHLQTNKVKYIIDYAYLIHSLDSLRLAEEIQKRAEQINRKVDVLIQVNTSGEDTKSGVEPSEAEQLCKEVSAFKNIRLSGLMTIGALTEDETEIRNNFKTLKTLYDSLKNEHKDFRYLSMGMTSDFRIAIEEGANMLRIGSAIFGNRTYTK